MRTANSRGVARPAPRPLFPDIAFGAAILLAGALFVYTPLYLVYGAHADGGGGGLLAVGAAVLTVLFGARWCLFFLFAYAANERGRRAPARAAGTAAELPPVSILVPAY